MIQITPHMRILVAVKPVDFRNHSAPLIIPSSGWAEGSSRYDPSAFVMFDSE